MDNADFRDTTSLSGTKSDHITMQVLYQELVSTQYSKPLVSEMAIDKVNQILPDKLPC